MEANEKDELHVRIEKRWQSFDRWAKFYSMMHHGLIFAGAILSFGAAIVLQVNGGLGALSAENWATILASAAGLAATIAGIGLFEPKWRANRNSRTKCEVLLLELVSAEVDLEKIRSEFGEALFFHDNGISGAES